jgi:thiol:disulfide interchange protein
MSDSFVYTPTMLNRIRLTVLLSLLVLPALALFTPPAAAQMGDLGIDDPVTVSTQLSVTPAIPGEEVLLAVIIDHADGWHTQPAAGGGSDELDFDSIPTTITVPETPPAGITFGDIQWPGTHMVSISYANATMPVYEGKAIAYLPVQVAEDAAPGEISFEVKVRFQACNDTTCIRPETKTFDIVLPVVAAADRGEAPMIDESIFSRYGEEGATTTVAGDTGETEPPAGTGGHERSVDTWTIGLWLIFAIVAASMLWMIVRTWQITSKMSWRLIITIIGLLTAGASFATVRAFTAEDDLWEPYTHAAFAEAEAAGQTIILDFTADWCPNCKTIEATTYRNKAVVAILERENVTPLRADLTGNNPEGWEKHRSFGAGGIPRNVVVRPGEEPVVWNSFFTADAFIAAVEGRAEAIDTSGGGTVIDIFGLRLNVSSVWVIILLAGIAGFLLNFTPCVLPVIPIKVLSLHQQAGNPARCLALGTSFGIGIVVFFLAVAIPIGVLKVIDWGEMFTKWWVNIPIGLLIGAMALGMMGLFTVKLPQKAYMFNPSHDTHTGSFLTGFLTGLLSTPCTGPMLGATIAWVVTQSTAMVLIVFGAMGVGMAFPYVILAANPKWVDRLPRTGPGSELVKQVMGLVLIAVAVYFFTIGAGTLTAGPPVESETAVEETAAYVMDVADLEKA